MLDKNDHSTMLDQIYFSMRTCLILEPYLISSEQDTRVDEIFDANVMCDHVLMKTGDGFGARSDGDFSSGVGGSSC